MKKKISSLVASLLVMVLFLSGCSKTGNGLKPLKFDTKASADFINSGAVVENNAYALQWDDTSKQIALVDKINNIVWSSNPSKSDEPELDEFGMPIKSHPLLSSDINVKYVEQKTGHVVSVNSYLGANSSGRISAKKIKNGLKVTYYFDELEFAIPVEYLLYKDGLKVTIKTKEIQENENRITEISVLPFMCSSANTAEDSYLFVPSGAGALIYPKEISSTGQNFRQEIYGNDLMVREYTNTSKQENIYLPVFGVKEGNKALCCIVENGAESSLIEGSIGGKTYKYSTIYSTLCVRGYDELRSVNYSGATLVTDYYTKDMADIEFTISYTPLYNDDANYTSMAKTYRNYLIDNLDFSSKGDNDATYSITFNGGFMAAKSFLGIPYESIYSLTTLEQAQQILEELLNETEQVPIVRLNGYGDTGLNKQHISGGYKVSSSLGGRKQLKELNSFCKENNIESYFNFDILHFEKSSNGWSKLYDSAKSATGKSYYPTGFTIAIRDKDNSTEYALVSRSEIVNSAKKLYDKTKKWNLDGYSIDSIGTISYSDYDTGNSYAKANISTDIISAMAVFKDKKVAVSGANAYAALNASHIFNVPLNSARFDVFDEDIPFYQLVFKGYVPISSTPINNKTLENDSLLACIESGTLPSWSLMYDYDNSAISFSSNELRNGVYSLYKDTIIKTINDTSKYYDAIKDTEIIEHSTFDNGVRITKYSNGVVAIVNRGDKTAETELGTIEAGEYKIGGINN